MPEVRRSHYIFCGSLKFLTIKHWVLIFVRIKNDDRMIQLEGLESLSEAELRQACRERGLLGLLSVEEMRQQVSFFLFNISIVLNGSPFFFFYDHLFYIWKSKWKFMIIN